MTKTQLQDKLLLLRELNRRYPTPQTSQSIKVIEERLSTIMNQKESYLVVELPDQRHLTLIDYEFTPGSGGSLTDPPEGPEVVVTRAAMWLNTPLGPESLNTLMEDDEVYEAILRAAEEEYSDVMEAKLGG